MATGCSKEDYNVSIGLGTCSVTDVTDNLLGCVPPSIIPEVGIESNNFDCQGNLPVLVWQADPLSKTI